MPGTDRAVVHRDNSIRLLQASPTAPVSWPTVANETERANARPTLSIVIATTGRPTLADAI